MSLGQNDGVKKLRELRKEIAQIKTVARERELGIHGAKPQAESSAPEKAAAKTKKSTPKTAGAKTKSAKTKKEAAK